MIDILKMLGSIACSIGAFISFFVGIATDNVIMGLLLGAFLIFCAYSFMNSVSKETYKEIDLHNEAKKEEKLSHGFKCPHCGENAGYKISALSKGASIATWGLVSDKIGKTYKCENCGYMW